MEIKTNKAFDRQRRSKLMFSISDINEMTSKYESIHHVVGAVLARIKCALSVIDEYKQPKWELALATEDMRTFDNLKEFLTTLNVIYNRVYCGLKELKLAILIGSCGSSHSSSPPEAVDNACIEKAEQFLSAVCDLIYPFPSHNHHRDDGDDDDERYSSAAVRSMLIDFITSSPEFETGDSRDFKSDIDYEFDLFDRMSLCLSVVPLHLFFPPMGKMVGKLESKSNSDTSEIVKKSLLLKLSKCGTVNEDDGDDDVFDVTLRLTEDVSARLYHRSDKTFDVLVSKSKEPLAFFKDSEDQNPSSSSSPFYVSLTNVNAINPHGEVEPCFGEFLACVESILNKTRQLCCYWSTENITAEYSDGISSAEDVY